VISVLVRRNDGEAERIGETVQNDLIVSDPQAATVGRQRLEGLRRKRTRSLSCPYKGVTDGDCVSVTCMEPAISGRHSVTSVSVEITREGGVWTSLETEL